MFKQTVWAMTFVLIAFAGRGTLGDSVADGALRVEVITAYNLVVDSNVESPSTYAPRAAYLGATFHNDGATTISNVYAYIGDHIDGVADTPGIYPARPHPPLVGPLTNGMFSLTHEGGGTGNADATRYIGDIEPGGSVTMYWLISYPNLDIKGKAVWGPSVKPDDDLWLEYDVWATGTEEGIERAPVVTRKVTMRNEISAAANKIFPNNANKVPDYYKELLDEYVPSWESAGDDGSPGTRVVAEGVWYDLGNVGHGFDNNGDLVPDKNAWLQPVGDADAFDASCFRLVHTYAIVVVKLKGGGEQILYGEDQLYFENIPENNGAVGWVGYHFMPLRGPCEVQLSPYQEVASGFDNEKFNGDYGAFLGFSMTSIEPRVELVKDADRATVGVGGTIHYTVSYTNSGQRPLGDPTAGVPLVLRDSIPEGTRYVAGSAVSSNQLPAGAASYSVLFSTNSGASWASAEPVPATGVTDIQWWLSDAMPTATVGAVRFAVTVEDPFTPPVPLIENIGELGFGNGPATLEDDAVTRVLGTNSLGDTVFADDGTGTAFGNGVQNASELGIPAITVSLYYDSNSNGTLEASDLLIEVQETGTGGGYLFTNLADGLYLAAVDWQDADLPVGYTLTTPEHFAVDLDAAGLSPNPVTYLDADFGFAPALSLDKALVGAGPVYEGQEISYTIDVLNRLPGNGTGLASPCEYTAWAEAEVTLSGGDKPWTDPANAYTPPGPDGIYAYAPFDNSNEKLTLTQFGLGPQAGSVSNVSIVAWILTSETFLANDNLAVRIFEGTAELFATQYLATALADGLLEIDVTDVRAWDWPDFSTNTFRIQFDADKGSGSSGGRIDMDAAGFRVTSDQSRGAGLASTVLQPVPLADTYATNQLEFVSASPPLSSASVTGAVGLLEWADLGPIYPGGTSSVTVTFSVLEPPGNQTAFITNTAAVLGARFLNGTDAGSATDRVETVVLPTGTIGDFVWRDLNGDGVQDGGNEAGIPNAQVRLTPPGDVDLGNGNGQPVTNLTDQSGLYLFTQLPTSGLYTVTILTDSLPGGTAGSANTYDEDGGTNAPNNETIVNLNIDVSDGSDNHVTADFGYRVPTTIDGLIWHDLNRSADAVRNSGEPWLTNVTVYLCAGLSSCGAGSALATNQTGVDGYFRFVGNFEGTHTVTVDTNSGPLAAGTWVGSFDTDGLGTPDYASVSVVTGGTAHVDFSYYQTGPYSIGDTLFYDWDGNGFQATNEEGIAAITVSLYWDADGDGQIDPGDDPLIDVDVTDSDGMYLFANRPSGTYIVVVNHGDPQFPPAYTQTADPDETNPTLNGDGRGIVVLTDTNRLDIDFGYQPLGSGVIGDTVWFDANADQAQAGVREVGLAGIAVTLFVDLNGDAVYVPVATAETDADGKYLFEDLPDGAYRVVVDSADSDLPLDAFGNRYFATTATTMSTTILNGNTYLDADFGFAALGAIGDTIFWDSNGNGTQDWNEEGISNITVRVYRDANTNGVYDAGPDVLVDTLNTDTNGNYLFNGLPADTYVVVVDTGSAAIVDARLSADPDADGVPCSDAGAIGCDNETAVTLAVGQSFMGADFGYLPLGSLGDTVWLDTDADGVRDGSELGIPYITVELRSNGVLVAETETDPDGYYIFGGLPDGAYEVVVLVTDTNFPVNLGQSFDPDGILDDMADPVILSGGEVVEIGTNACTGCSLDVDFGYRYAGTNVLSGTVGLDGVVQDGLLGNSDSGVNLDEAPFPGHPVFVYVWTDANSNSTIDAGETVLIDSTTTATNGDYRFTGLPDGQPGDRYVVSLSAPAGGLTMTTTTGDTPALWVSETTNALGEALSALQVVAIAPETTNIDFAFVLAAAYDFGDLPASYSTRLEDIPGGARHEVNAVPDLYLGSGVDTEGNGQPTANATGDDLAGSDDEDGVTVAGIWRDGPGGGRVDVIVGAGDGWLVGWIDFDRSGNFTGSGEMIVNQAVSSAGGPYALTFDVPGGTISATTSSVLNARFRLFSSEPSLPEITYSGAADNGEVEDYQWSPGDNGYGSIGDRVWLDEDGDGVQDAGEDGIANVQLVLYGPGDVPVSTTRTDTAGEYLFSALSAADYRVAVDTASLPAGLAANQTGDPDATFDDQTSVALQIGQEFVQADFGYNWSTTTDTGNGTGTGAIGDRIWIDTNGDGIQDPGEPGFAGLTVNLYRDADGNGTYETLVATTNTDASGLYIFDDLPAGAYVVEVNGGTAPAGYTATGDPDATLDNRTTYPVVLGPGDVYVNADFGYRPGAVHSIGDTVYFDANADGTNDPADYGIAGVSVALVADTNSNGVWDASEPIIASDLTDGNGQYLFAGLPDGAYLVWVNDTRGVLTGLDQTADPDTMLDGLGAVTLSGTDNLDQDFGYAPAAHQTVKGLIGDTIFMDRNNSGTPQAGEGIEGVVVELIDTNGTPLARATTDENGRYYFGGLADGTYTVRVDTATLPAGITNTTDPDGGTPNRSTVTIIGAAINLDQDFGYQDQTTPNTIGGTVWQDRNADGTLDGAESNRFSGVTVVLYDTNGNVVATTTTDGNGNYTFTGLPDGTYDVDVTDDANVLNGHWHSDGPNDGADNNSQVDPYRVTVTGGATDTTGDFGYYIDGAALGNRAWLDTSEDGIQDAGEPGLAGVQMTLSVNYSGTVVTVVTISDGSGFYGFGNLLLDENYNGDGSGPEPSYSISADIPTGYVVTFVDIPAPGDLADSDAHGGVTAQAVQGQTDIAAQTPVTGETMAASYDFGYIELPTLALLTRFGAVLRDGEVVIEWETAYEIDTLGFFLERQTGSGAYVAVNTAIILSDPFSSEGAAYEQVDAGAEPGQAHTYRLIEVEIDGTLRYLGPYTVSTGAPALSLADWSRLEFTPEELADQAVSGPDSDPDGDGLTNYQEYLAGTSPTDAADVLRILDLDDAANGMTIRWRSVADRVYAVQVAADLSGPYGPVADGIVGTPPENAYTDTANRGAEAFYRIRLVTPE